ncbi:MAG TPA: DUF418 domain-containing protein [Aliicoccus persicus]|uniref:DUF418 domain-containing protein n=1 Tax=Aliicoccus persicus TaxID=930138 RepID=A0A921DYI9_9STAP|nr:DUF418 domain-containing protein [Aliicoccus persicus]
MFNKRFIKLSLAFALLLLLLLNGLHYMMPYSVINPYEYFQSSERSLYQVLSIFIGGTTVTLVAIIIGYAMSYVGGAKPFRLFKTGGVLLIGSILIAVFIFGFEQFPYILFAALIAVFFIRSHWMLLLVSSTIIYILYIMSSILPSYLSTVVSNYDVIYSAIQEITEYTRVFSSTDYFAILALNTSLLTDNFFSAMYASLFTVLPWILVGMFAHKLRIDEVIEEHTMMSFILFATLVSSSIALKLIQMFALGSYSGNLISDNIAGPLLAISYFLLIAFIVKVLPERMTHPFETLGKYVLSAYLLSHIANFFIYYGVGFSMYGEVSLLQSIITTLIIFVVLLVLANVAERYKITMLENYVFKEY